MLEPKENTVKIEGILSEVDLKDGSFTKKDGTKMDSIGGVIKVRVNQDINGESKELEIPVHMFASKLTNKGTPNPAYDAINRIRNEFVSIAASDIDTATRVRITKGKLTMNEYVGQNGQVISFPRVSASFVTPIKKEDCKPEASFTTIFVVGEAMNETDKEGVETGRYMIKAIVPQFGGSVDIVLFYAINPGVIDAVSQYWNKGDTVKASGRLNFTSRTETTVDNSGFGEPITSTKTISVSELIITGGSPSPLEGDFAFNLDEINAAVADRKNRIEDMKAKGSTKSAAKTPAKGSGLADLGF